MEKFQFAYDLLTAVVDDYEKAKKGNKSAERRVRKATVTAEKLFKEFRKETIQK